MATPSTGSAAQQAKDKAQDLADKATDKAADLAGTAKGQAGDLVNQAKSTATDTLSTGKERATGLLGNVAEALHATSDTLHDNDQDAFARYADVAARQVEDFTSAIRGRSVGELLDEAEGFARREPALFLGGAFLLGIFGARFLKAGTDGSGGSTRSLLSGMTLPGGEGGHQSVANVNRPPGTAYGRDLSQGQASGGSMAGGTARTGALSGGNLPAGNPAAAGSGSMRTAVGTAGAGADAPVRSGTGATPMSTSPMSGSGTPGSGTTATGTTGSGRTGADPS